MANNNPCRCVMCGAVDSPNNRVITIFQDLTLCCDCIDMIDSQRDTQLDLEKKTKDDKHTSAPKNKRYQSHKK